MDQKTQFSDKAKQDALTKALVGSLVPIWRRPQALRQRENYSGPFKNLDKIERKLDTVANTVAVIARSLPLMRDKAIFISRQIDQSDLNSNGLLNAFTNALEKRGLSIDSKEFEAEAEGSSYTGYTYKNRVSLDIVKS